MLLATLTLALVQGAAAAVAPMTGPLPPAVAWTQPRTPADSVYRLARRALEGDDLERAAQLFAYLRTRYPSSPYTQDAGYWEGFALYRLSGQARLLAARVVLQEQVERYPKAATSGDARSLITRINGQLARGGDAASAEALATTIEAVATISAGQAALAPAVAELRGQAVAATASAMAPAMAGRGTRDDDEPAECRTGDSDEKIEALNALMHVDAERAVPVLAKVLKRRDPCSVRLRRKAVFIVAQQKRAGAEDVLLDAIRTDPDRVVREQGVFWLGQVGTERAVAALDDIITSEGDAGVRRKAIFSMGQLKAPGASEKLAAYAGRRELGPDLQGEALQWLGQRDGGAAMVRGIFGKLQDPRLKERALFAASQGRDASGAKWLLEVARDTREPGEVRRKALFWASQSREVDLADLDACYDAAGNDREFKTQFAFALSQRRETGAIDRLMTMAKRDPDREVRKKAIFWLSQSRDPRVAKFLEDLIGNP